MARLTSQDGTALGYDQIGAGPALILVDGAMAHRAYRGGRPLAAELAKRFTVVTYDRRGRGESSDTQPYAVEREIEDIEAILKQLDRPAHLYGFSSGSVLALRAAAQLGSRVLSLAVLEPPFSPSEPEAKREFTQFGANMRELLGAGKRSDAVELFLKDMLPPEVLEGMKQSPEWSAMEQVAHTLAYDIAVLGDGCVPVDVAASVKVRALVLEGGESDAFKHEAADALVQALPNARRFTLRDQRTMVPPEILAPVLIEFYTSSSGSGA